MAAIFKKQRLKLGDSIFNAVNIFLMALVFIFCAYPFYHCIMLSFNDGLDAASGNIYLIPRMFTLDNYQAVFRSQYLWSAFLVTMARTVIGTVLGVLLNAMMGYALMKKELKFRKIYITIGIITMYFYGGIIPLYLLVNAMGLIDHFSVYILLNLYGFFNVIVFMSFFKTIPVSLMESAKIDGANEFVIFRKIILPVSTPVLATIALFIGVHHWNNWLDPFLFTSKPELKTLPIILMEMINKSLADQLAMSSGKMAIAEHIGVTGNSVQLAAMTVAVVPIMAVYPFLQKYFAKGLMLGSVKG